MSFCAFKKRFCEEPVCLPSHAQLGPNRGVLKKSPTPATAHKSGPEAITQRSEMCRNDTKDIQRKTVDRDERIPPPVDGRQRGQGVSGKLRKLEKGY